MDNQEEKKRENNKIYFLIAVIVALLSTSVYLFIQKTKTEDRIVTVTEERTALQSDLEKLETELEQANNANTKTTEELKSKDEQLKTKIDELRKALANGTLNKGDLAKAKAELQALRAMVSNYKADIELLQRRNSILTGQRDSLQSTVLSVSKQAEDLARRNDSLNTRVKAGSALKTGAINIISFKIKSSGKEVDVDKASSAKKIKINFSIPANPIATKGTHEIFVRLLDPSNALITGEDGTFSADGLDLQYTYKTSIDYSGESKSYTIDWINKGAFAPGTYTVILYSDNSTMGKGTFNLK